MKIIKLFGFIAALSASCMQAEYYVITFNSNPRLSKTSPDYKEFTKTPVRSEAERRTPHGIYNQYHTDGKTIYFTDFMDKQHVVTTDDKGLILATNTLGEQNAFLYNLNDPVSVIQANIFLWTRRIELAEKCLETQHREEGKTKGTAFSHIYYAEAILSNMANIEKLRKELAEFNSKLTAMAASTDSTNEASASARRK